MNSLDDAPEFALSIKQPWATLVLLGLKTVEIRSWTTAVRGRVYLHAGKIPDDRVEGWSRIPEEHFGLTNRRGGLIGTVEIVECLTYASPTAFVRHRHLHLNEAAWFLPPRMFGFRFDRPTIVPFRATPGQVKFFTVPSVLRQAGDAEFRLTSEPSPVVAPDPLVKKKRVTFELDVGRMKRRGKRTP